ncbi:hypothetical protein KDD93_08460 [Campylobacter sp. faydin G-24]|uniref:DeoR C-terminal sensor domain-containing protein n=1 Tax=Campylobacter anatolicus TaxID=2829105 RepID=A0ABS5HJZ0_9BACT|nr:hypothetical protein [Campylobacter anatolicus]MBR8464589.1 hypothetical protein [Campylobacter anatolicus]MBR8465723.1 hypothetical protein [Campylobacter anatolicus]
MQLIGHELVAYEPLFVVSSESQIMAGRVNLFDFDKNMIAYANELNTEFAVYCSDVSQAIIANAAGAKLIIANELEKAKKFAEFAQFYLFDSKIAYVINDEVELETLAQNGVDVAIFKKGIDNGDI